MVKIWRAILKRDGAKPVIPKRWYTQVGGGAFVCGHVMSVGQQLGRYASLDPAA